MARRNDSPRRRGRRSFPQRSGNGDHHAVRTESRSGGRGPDPGLVSDARVPQRQDRAERSAIVQDHGVEYRPQREVAGCPCRRDRLSGGHGPGSGQHPAESPASRRIRQAGKGVRICSGPSGPGARREGTGQGRLRRHHRGRPGVVESAPAGAVDLSWRQGPQGCSDGGPDR